MKSLYIFSSGADPNTEGMLHTAAAAGQEALVAILLDFGAQVGCPDIHFCARFRQSDNVVKMNKKDFQDFRTTNNFFLLSFGSLQENMRKSANIYCLDSNRA